MLMVVFHQQNLPYGAQKEYRYPQPPMGLQVMGCLNVVLHMLPLHLCIYLFYIFLLFTSLFHTHILMAEEWILTLEKYRNWP